MQSPSRNGIRCILAFKSVSWCQLFLDSTDQISCTLNIKANVCLQSNSGGVHIYWYVDITRSRHHGHQLLIDAPERISNSLTNFNPFFSVNASAINWRLGNIVFVTHAFSDQDLIS